MLPTPLNNTNLKPAIFLDRDGVINYDYGYIGTYERFTFLPNAITALKCLQDLGFALVIVTNQSGIARGFFSFDDYHRLTQAYIKTLLQHDVQIMDVFVCPHYASGTVFPYNVKCACRKPLPGLIKRATTLYSLSLSHSFMVGDKDSDIEAGQAAGITGLVKINSSTTNTSTTLKYPLALQFNSLYDFSMWLTSCIS